MKVLLLYSGGADSLLMLMLATKLGHEVTPIMFDYGQKHVEELDYGRRLLSKVPQTRQKPVIKLDIKGAFQTTQSTLLGSVIHRYANVHEAHVPGRNMVFISCAFSVAETHDMDEIWIGCDYSDRENNFPDCYQEWVHTMDQLTQIAGSRPIRVRAPLLGFTKEMVHEMLKAEGIDLSDVFSGYEAPAPKTEEVVA